MSLPATVTGSLAEPPQPWYLGAISPGAAERLLRDKFEVGDFLVRREGAGWALSVLTPSRSVEHFPVMWCEPGFALTQEPGSLFPSLVELITHFRTTPLFTTSDGIDVLLANGVGVNGLPRASPAGAEPSLRSVVPIDRRAGLPPD